MYAPIYILCAVIEMMIIFKLFKTSSINWIMSICRSVQKGFLISFLWIQLHSAPLPPSLSVEEDYNTEI